MSDVRCEIRNERIERTGMRDWRWDKRGGVRGDVRGNERKTGKDTWKGI